MNAFSTKSKTVLRDKTGDCFRDLLDDVQRYSGSAFRKLHMKDRSWSRFLGRGEQLREEIARVRTHVSSLLRRYNERFVSKVRTDPTLRSENLLHPYRGVA